ncbi:MAG: hypothetical protein HY454_01520 [Parcubacteria group bacterium]|nr:hypothetical protein [Parcubacteria group bacterium]
MKFFNNPWQIKKLSPLSKGAPHMHIDFIDITTIDITTRMIILIIISSLTALLIYRGRNEKAEAEEAEWTAWKAWKAAEAEREDRLLQCHRQEQHGYHEQMVVLGEKSIGLFEEMSKHLTSAEYRLDRAEADFTDGAFAPFWDSVEGAARSLAHFNEGVQCIKNNSRNYTELTRKYEDVPPQFPLACQSIEKLSTGTETAKRMQVIVRKAQCNFQFAMIYEQRKTNQILVAGFTNLADALVMMSWRITSSIGDLASSVDGMVSTLNESMQTIHSRMGDIAKTASQRHNEVMEKESERATRERKALEMLDNIQCRRKPAL